MATSDPQIGSTEWPLKIRALRGGAVSEVASFLDDMEHAYHALYSFDLAVSRWYRARRFWRRFGPFEPFDLYPFDSALGLVTTHFEPIVPEYQLELVKVSIQSPGFWEFLGGLNPLQQIREYLNDRHERRKDHEYRELAEREKLRLDNELIQRQILEKENSILREQLAIMREAGLSDVETRQFIWARLGKPLSQLGRHQDSRLIEGAVEERGKDGETTSQCL